ncbi:MAG: winged helix-turn-helix transcriptional regulator [Thermofilaceae archaeon]|nr:winged helix-turn-helix transcriptional regulator [Thermofilaceae archaeon]MCX8180084.1 winged helix-turn-helix transcriptional regulator [Thermofilaceae archaeon]MDW8004261.1 winged helix-turn-helix transcriptional regulator [Thermofilaceae archaeon]
MHVTLFKSKTPLYVILVTSLTATAAALLSYAQRQITVTSAAVVEVKELDSDHGKVYVITVEIPPLTRLTSEKLACIYGINVTEVSTQWGNTTFEGGCLLLSADNPSPRTLTVTVELKGVELQRPQPPPQPPVLTAATIAAVAVSSYLALTENGRQKLYSTISIPAAYLVVNRKDVERNPKRMKILEYIRTHPGATIRRISRETGISYGEVQWHLSILERLEIIKSVKIGRYVYYFDKSISKEELLQHLPKS